MIDLISKILVTISEESTRLSLLTDIQISTSSEEVNQACIDLREQIVDGTFKGEEIKINDLI
jgi:hypothetical protein